MSDMKQDRYGDPM